MLLIHRFENLTVKRNYPRSAAYGIFKETLQSRRESYKGRMRMKKVLLALILVALVLVPAAAATERASKTDLAVGLNLGTNNGVGIQYRIPHSSP